MYRFAYLNQVTRSCSRYYNGILSSFVCNNDLQWRLVLPRVFLGGGYSHALVLLRWIPPSPGRVCFCFGKLFLRAGAGSSKAPDSCMLWRGFEGEDFPRVRLSDTKKPKAGLNYGRIGEMRG